MVGNTQGLRLAITGGGTGGHVLPALAVVDELRRRDALADLIWIGSREGVERSRRRKKPASSSSPYQPGNSAATSHCETSPTPRACRLVCWPRGERWPRSAQTSF